MSEIDYERKDYKNLAKEFGIHIRFGKYGIKFFQRDPTGKIYKFISVIPLTGWITNPKEIERVIREQGGL